MRTERWLIVQVPNYTSLYIRIYYLPNKTKLNASFLLSIVYQINSPYYSAISCPVIKCFMNECVAAKLDNY